MSLRYPGTRPGNPFLKKRRPIDTIRRMRDLPVLFIHGTKDVIVGVAHSRRLFDAVHEPKRLQLVADGSHAVMLFRKDPTGFMGLITDWLAEAPAIWSYALNFARNACAAKAVRADD